MVTSQPRAEVDPATSTDPRDARIAEALREYHDALAAGAPPPIHAFKERLAEDEFEFLSALLDMGDLLEDPELSVHESALPRAFAGYTLQRELGRGATGVVYEAIPQDGGAPLALKIMSSGFEDDVARERFLREAGACGRIDHPSVVQVLDSGEAEGHPFYAMTKIDGHPLSRHLGSAGLNIQAVCRRAADIADALAELHDNGIVHRDVKPANILVSSDDRWILADFGHVRNDAELTLTRTGDTLGTPLYMSPEQVRGVKDIDGRADVYALGATLYHLVTGTPVHRADDIASLMRAVLHDRVEALHCRTGGLPTELDLVVRKCLEKRRQDRYATVRELAADLRAVANGTTVQGRPVSGVRHALRAIPRHPILTTATALVLMGIAWVLLPKTPVLMIETLEGASIAVRGSRDVAKAPVHDPIPLRIGEAEFTVSRPGFRPRTERFDAESGGEYHFRKFALAPLHPDDENSQLLLLTFMGVLDGDHAKPIEVPLQRDARTPGTRAPTLAVYPRGKVTASDLDTWFVAVGDDLEADGTIVWSQGDRELARQAFDPIHKQVHGKVPEAAREALQIGDRLTWRIEADGRALASSTAQLVAPVPETALDEMEQDLEDVTMPDALRRALRARVWIARGLLTRALRATETKAATRSQSLAKLRVEALRGLFRDEAASLHASDLWVSAVTGIQPHARSK